MNVLSILQPLIIKTNKMAKKAAKTVAKEAENEYTFKMVLLDAVYDTRTEHIRTETGKNVSEAFQKARIALETANHLKVVSSCLHSEE